MINDGTIINITFYNNNYKCPYCKRVGYESEGIFERRIINGRNGYTKTVCNCGKEIGIAIDYTSKMLAFKLV